MLPSINWESPWVWAVIILTAVHFAVHAATFLAITILLIKLGKSKISKGAKALSALLSKWGFSANITAPIDDVASGSPMAFMSDGLKEAQYLNNAANRVTEAQSFLSTAMSDPVVGPPLTQWLTDKLAGASASTLTADATATQTAFDSTLPTLSPAFSQLVHIVDSLPAGGTSIADIANLFSSNTATAPIAGVATKLVALGHSIGKAAGVAPAAVPLVVGAAAAPALTPVLVPAALAAGTVAGGLQVTGALAPGHSATFTNTTPVPAATTPVTPAAA